MGPLIRRRRLSRRALLRGAGAALALPWLSAMAPACTRRPAAGPLRTCFVFAPNGMVMDAWRPEGTGRAFRPGPTLEPLEPYRDALLVISGLALDAGRAHGDGPGDHARAASTFLTGTHPKKTPGGDVRCGPSVDQVIAQKFGLGTALPSLELGMERGRRSGSCDSGYACAYSNHVSWRSPTVPVAKETSPREVFARLFGDPDDLRSRAERRRRLRERRSVLDVVAEDARSLRGRLGPADRAKLEQYLDAVRVLERRLAGAEPERPGVPVPDALRDDSGGGYTERLRLMYTLIALAFETDRTRTVTFMLGNAGSNRSYRHLDVPEAHHRLSHHGGKPDKLAALRKIDRWHAGELARFLGTLRRTMEPGGSLLDQTVVLYGSGLGDGDRHEHGDLPILLAGRGGGRIRTGRHLVCPEETPMANLHLAIMDIAGVRLHAFADSTGRLDV